MNSASMSTLFENQKSSLKRLEINDYNYDAGCLSFHWIPNLQTLCANSIHRGNAEGPIKYFIAFDEGAMRHLSLGAEVAAVQRIDGC